MASPIRNQIAYRTPTLCFNLPGTSPDKVTEKLAEQNIGVRDGHMYSPRLMKRLGAHQRERCGESFIGALQHAGRGEKVRQHAGGDAAGMKTPGLHAGLTHHERSTTFSRDCR